MKKHIVITGSRKGLGRYLAEYFLSKGHLVFGCSRGESDLQHTNYSHRCLDVADEPQVASFIKDIVQKHNRIDILINNAGIASMNPIALTPLCTIQSIFSTNVMGSFIFLREVAKQMIRKRFGRIINFATVATPLDLEGEAAYAASKAAVESLTRIAAKEFAPMGITVNAIGPTPVPTDLIKNVPKAKMDALLDQQAIKRFGTEEDVLQVIKFFVDDKSDFITGQIIYLGGVN